jgi:hypothetical protein
VQQEMKREPDEEREIKGVDWSDDGRSEREERERDPPVMVNNVSEEEEEREGGVAVPLETL